MTPDLDTLRDTDRLDPFEWPDNIRMVPCEATPEARYETLTNIIAELAAK